MTIRTIAFDGMHRCGKWTQIGLLQQHLIQHKTGNDLVLTMRWEYYRPGTWDNDLTDPFSQRWADHKYTDNYDEKSRRLNRELYYTISKKLPRHMEQKQIQHTDVILDRSVVGKYLFSAGEKKSIPAPAWEWHTIWTRSYPVIIPDHIYVLQPTQDELLRRLDAHAALVPPTPDNITRYAYKKQYISQSYDAYYGWIDSIPAHIRDRIIHIQGNYSAEDIYQKIVALTKNGETI
jgi:thymidylate kinase